ncbi:MAG: hypothetical protein HYV07_01575 [Deltaproteobacteria bacterium]|nr:hypothetical protein [Deltaproteobacteria bacterium]
MGKLEILSLTSLALTACASTRPGSFAADLKSPFPPREALKELSERPRPDTAKVLAERFLDVDHFDLVGMLPDVLGSRPVEATGPLIDLLVAAAARKPGLVTVGEDMNCVARQIARFYLVHGKQPGSAFQTFVSARCGAPVASFATFTVTGSMPAKMGDSEVVTQAHEHVESSIEHALGSGARILGGAIARGESSLVIAIVAGERRAHLEVVPAVPVDGSVKIAGELLSQASLVRALVTSGRFGVRDCTDRAAKLPAYHFDCPINPEDSSAYVQVYSLPPGRLLAFPVLTLLARKNGEAVAAYHRPVVALEGDTLDSKINAVRARAELPPLSFSVPESQIATTLAPHFFAAMVGDTEATVADEIALGLQAGWEIEGVVQYGSFSSAILAGSTDVDRFIHAALELPMGRETLLDPRAAHLAVGMMELANDSGLAAVFSTYRPVRAEDHAALAQQVLDALNRRRQHPAKLLDVVRERAAELANDVQRGKTSIEEATNDLARSALSGGRSVRSWMFAVPELSQIPFPEELLGGESAEIGAAVAVTRLPGQAWATYLVVIVEPVSLDT